MMNRYPNDPTNYNGNLNSSGKKKEAIVEKLNYALSSFRRERDQIHREKELADERLRLAVEERQEIESTVAAMQAKLDELTQITIANQNDQDKNNNINMLQEEVERLGKEAKYQHSELVSKREKFERLQKSMMTQHKSRNASLAAAKKASQQQREKIDWNASHYYNDNGDMSSHLHQERNKNPNYLVDLVTLHKFDISGHDDDASDDNIIARLPQLVKEKSRAIATNASDIQSVNDSLRKRINGYTQYLGATV